METRLEDLRKWFGKGKKGDWVRVGTDGEIKGDCAREPGEGKPKCMPRSKAHSMSKKDRASSARRKRRADPSVDRPGTGNKPIMVKTDKKESVEMKEASKVPAGMKFIASYVYKDANGKDHTHRHLRKGSKMTDPVVVYIDGKEWKTFQSFTKAKQAAISHIKGMKESVNENVNMKNVDKLKAAARDFGKNRDINFKSIEDALMTIVQSMRVLDKSTSGRADYKSEKIIDKQIVRINNIINKTNYGKTGQSEEGKEIVKILNKHKLNGPRGFHKVIYEGVEMNDLEEKNVPTNPALWAKFKAQAKAKFDVYPSAYANGWAAKKYKAAGGGWKTTKESTEMKSFWDIRESKESVEEGTFMITVHKAGPGGKDLNMKVMGKNRMDAAKAFRKSNPRYKNDEISVKESVEMNEEFVVKYAKNKRGPIYQTKFKTQPEAEKFLAQKRKEGMNGIVSKAGKPVSMQKMKDMQKEEVEQLDELSPNTVKSYLNKRTMDTDNKRTQYSYQKKARDAQKAGNETEAEKNRAKAKKIGTGIHRATARDVARDTGSDQYRHKSVKRVPQAYKNRAND